MLQFTERECQGMAWAKQQIGLIHRKINCLNNQLVLVIHLFLYFTDGHACMHECDQLCQNQPLMHTTPKNSFRQCMDSFINKLIGGSAFAEACFRGLFPRHVQHLQVLGCALNATGWLVQAIALLEITLLEITPQLIHDIGHGLNHIYHILSVMGPSTHLFTLQIAELHCNLLLCGSLPPPTLHHKCLWCW